MVEGPAERRTKGHASRSGLRYTIDHRSYIVARLVAAAFLEAPDDTTTGMAPKVVHLDGDASNNSAANLRWSTSAADGKKKKKKSPAAARPRRRGATWSAIVG